MPFASSRHGLSECSLNSSINPSILAYLVGGFAIGPAGFGLVQGQESVSIISELGLIFLLFMIGLEIDLKKIISAGRQSW